MDAVHSPWFWMRSAGFAWDVLEGFVAVPQGAAQHSLHEVLQHLQHMHGLQANIEQQVKTHSPEALAKVQRRFAERQGLQASDLPLAVRGMVDADLQKRQALMDTLQSLHAVLHVQFNEAQACNRVQLARCFQDLKLREAVFMSNPEALKRMDDLLGSVQSEPSPKIVLDSRSRQRLRLAWNYLQRFCAKNDTASFFGPMAWGRWVLQSTSPVHLQPQGPSLAQRQTFLEHWVVHAMTQAMAQDPELWLELPLFLSPSCDLRGHTLHYPVGKRIVLEGWAWQWVDLLHKHRQKPQGASQPISLSNQLKHPAWQADAVHAQQHLEALIAKSVVLRGVFLAPGSPQPLQRFRDVLQTMLTPRRYDWLEWLDDVERQVQRYASAGLVQRIESLSALCAVLHTMGVSTDRQTGAMYVGRFPVYEDCARGLNLELGQALSQSLCTSLAPVLKLYDWLMGAIVVRVRDAWLEHTNFLPNEPIDFLAFYTQTRRIDLHVEVVQPLRAVLTQAWSFILQSSSSAPEHVMSEDEFALLMQRLMQAEPRALMAAKGLWQVHSPDVMLAANSMDAINRGDYLWVMGELHPGVHTVSQPVALPFCPWLQEVLDEVNALLKPGTVVVADSDSHYQRSHIDWPLVPSLHQVALPGASPKVPAERVWYAGQLQVLFQDGELWLLHPERMQRQPLLTALPSDVHRCAFELAADVLGYAWSTRLVYRNLLLKRRSWTLNSEELPAKGLLPSENYHAYLDWQVWRMQHDMPVQVFVKIQNEPKPVLLDYNNPLSLDLLVNLSKPSVVLRFSEMRPSPNELWFEQAEGRHCSEFRMSFAPQCFVD